MHAALTDPPPDADDVRTFVVVRAGNEDVFEAAELCANRLHLRILQADEIDAGDRDPVIATGQYDGAGKERIVDAFALRLGA